MRRPWALGAGLAALALLVGLALVVRSRADRFETAAERRERSLPPAPGAAAAPSPAPGKAPAPSAAPVHPLQAGTQALLKAQGKALLELLRILETKGGAAALDHIRAAVLKPAASTDERLHQAYLARLIAFVAQSDPSQTAAALALSREILQSAAADPWARLQAAAGLGGLSASKALPLSVPGRPLDYLFLVEPPDPTAEGPFAASLLGAARQDAATAAALPSVLLQEEHSGVRQALVRSIGEIGGPGSADALRGAALSDPERDVRLASLSALERSASPELGEVARRIARTDEDPELQAEALGLIGRNAKSDPAALPFLADCLANQEPRAALPALASSAFAAMEAGAAPALQDGLSRLLLQQAGNAELAETFAREAVDRELPQLLPLLRTLETSLPPDSPSRASLGRAAKQLEEAPRYAALSRRLRDVEAESLALRTESAKPSTPEGRRTEIQTRLQTLYSELWDVERTLGR